MFSGFPCFFFCVFVFVFFWSVSLISCLSFRLVSLLFSFLVCSSHLSSWLVWLVWLVLLGVVSFGLFFGVLFFGSSRRPSRRCSSSFFVFFFLLSFHLLRPFCRVCPCVLFLSLNLSLCLSLCLSCPCAHTHTHTILLHHHHHHRPRSLKKTR